MGAVYFYLFIYFQSQIRPRALEQNFSGYLLPQAASSSQVRSRSCCDLASTLLYRSRGDSKASLGQAPALPGKVEPRGPLAKGPGVRLRDLSAERRPSTPWSKAPPP